LSLEFSLAIDAFELICEMRGVAAHDFDWLYELRHLISDGMSLTICIWWLTTLAGLIRLQPVDPLAG